MSLLKGPLGARHFSPFRVFLWRPAKFAIVLNPKVGSSFLRDLLAEGVRSQLGWRDASQGRYRLLKMARQMPLAPLGDYMDFLRHPEGYAVHTIVRNPYARLVSAWRDKFRDGHMATPDGRTAGYPRSIRKGVLRAARAHARSKGLPGAAEGELVPFATFLSFVESEPEGRRNSHWETQAVVLMQDRLPQTRAMRLEDGIGDPLAEILAPMGFDPDWVRGRAGTPVNASSRLREPVLDAGLAARIERLYARDFDLYGYDRYSWRGL